MMNLIQLLTDQRANEGITHSRWGASWNWRWRRVGDDEALLQDAANATLRSETLQETVCDAIIANGAV